MKLKSYKTHKCYVIARNDSHTWAVYRNVIDMAWNKKLWQATSIKACIKWIDAQ